MLSLLSFNLIIHLLVVFGRIGQPPSEASPPSYICPLIGDLDMRGRLPQGKEDGRSKMEEVRWKK